ncbi:hypothetical protein VQ042_02265 [Aurantimonas sp. A2-1-M11]
MAAADDDSRALRRPRQDRPFRLGNIDHIAVAPVLGALAGHHMTGDPYGGLARDDRRVGALIFADGQRSPDQREAGADQERMQHRLADRPCGEAEHRNGGGNDEPEARRPSAPMDDRNADH